MALPSTAVFEVRQGASDSNGGGFNPSRGGGGVDRSQQDSPYVDIDNGELVVTVHSTTTQVTGTLLAVSTADLGNFLQITGGTATAGVYEITAVDTINRRWTLDRSAGTSGQTIVGRMGGAFATPGKAATVIGSVNSTGVYWKAGSYTSSATITFPTGTRVFGYASSRGDGTVSNGPTLTASAGSITLLGVANGGTSITFANIRVNGGGQSSVVGFNLRNSSFSEARNHAVSCTATSCATGYQGVAGVCTSTVNCVATSCTVGYSRLDCYGCESVSSTTGFQGISTASIFDRCTASGGTTPFDVSSGGQSMLSNCVAYGGSGNGFKSDYSGNSSGSVLVNCIAYGNGASGALFSGANCNAVVMNCAFGANTTAAITAIGNGLSINNVTLSADPFTNAASGNFALNSTSGGGAACKAAGIPGAFPGGTTTGYLDIGAAQTQASTAGYARRSH